MVRAYYNSSPLSWFLSSSMARISLSSNSANTNDKEDEGEDGDTREGIMDNEDDEVLQLVIATDGFMALWGILKNTLNLRETLGLSSETTDFYFTDEEG